MRIALLALSSLAILACSSNSTDPATPPAGDIMIVAGAASKGATAYDPNPKTVSLATHATVIWGNADGVTHTVTDDGGAFDSGNITGGEGYSHTFVATGTYTYHCKVHPSMVGTLVVN